MTYSVYGYPPQDNPQTT
jgi:hypothetical protein